MPVDSDGFAVEPVKRVDDAEPDASVKHPGVVRRSSRQGAAIGTATHRVLELLDDLRQPSAIQIANLTRLACAEAGIPELHANIEVRVWSALGSEVLQRALTEGGRPLSEVYLIVQDGDRFLEGYIDLLVEEAAGLTILDYKTDRAVTAEELAAKQAAYAPQLKAYARATQTVSERPVIASELVFAGDGSR